MYGVQDNTHIWIEIHKRSTSCTIRSHKSITLKTIIYIYTPIKACTIRGRIFLYTEYMLSFINVLRIYQSSYTFKEKRRIVKRNYMI